MKKALFHGLLAGLLAASAAILYSIVYSRAMMADFSQIINIPRLLGINLIGCLIASIGYHLFSKMVHRNTDAWFNIIFILITFSTFVPVFLASLPLDIQSPELFVGLAIPIHLFPVLFWLGSKPVFWK